MGVGSMPPWGEDQNLPNRLDQKEMGEPKMTGEKAKKRFTSNRA